MWANFGEVNLASEVYLLISIPCKGMSILYVWCNTSHQLSHDYVSREGKHTSFLVKAHDYTSFWRWHTFFVRSVQALLFIRNAPWVLRMFWSLWMWDVSGWSYFFSFSFPTNKPLGESIYWMAKFTDSLVLITKGEANLHMIWNQKMLWLNWFSYSLQMNKMFIPSIQSWVYFAYCN